MLTTPHWTGDANTFVDTLFAWMKIAGLVCRCGSETLLSRSLCVADRARADGAGRSDICAGLLHSVGTLLIYTDFSSDTGNIRSRNYEIGARWLSGMFPHSVAGPVRLLPDARRWLFATDKAFRDILSDEALREMAYEGGPMTGSERQIFEGREGFDAAIALCRRIEWSKTRPCTHWTSNDLDRFRQQVVGCLLASPSGRSVTPARPNYDAPVPAAPLPGQTAAG